ncbi:uncharacterized protein N7511_001581 [Penicillium nucicola]|uniref:uncharacterized protein n=1 Tax=Penicillium nucicola TaxID=1850975 RepID=UPI0025453567|nr:uncharacterized protein N7511_001581 [Penicillium nucicola]KAJ5776570.1 hypothetical protein N7511_001581 [Penicillium nucicola]
MSEFDASQTSYEGSCHCGQVAFTVKVSPPIEDQTLKSCNCSICDLKGYVLLYAARDDVTFQENEPNARKEYRFGTMNFPHGFCSNCGVSMYARADGGKYSDIIAVNARTLKGVDVSTLNIKQADGKSIELS